MAATMTNRAASSSRFELAQPKYRGRIKAFARQNFRSLPGFEQQDLEGEILEVLWLACVAYDPNHGACFNTLFWTCAKRRFLDLHKAATRKMRVGDYHRVWLDDESLRETIGEYLDSSAEDEAIARMNVTQIYRTGVAMKE